MESANFSRAAFSSLTELDMPIVLELILDGAGLGAYASEPLIGQAWPINASHVGLRFPQEPHQKLFKDTSRLDRLIIDQSLYDSHANEIDDFASEEGNTVTIIGYGDANKDGVFNSNELVQVFQAGEYEDDIAENSYWTTGDWNNDRDFDSSNLVVAFQAGSYEVETAAVVVVPEPSSALLLLRDIAVLTQRRRQC